MIVSNGYQLGYHFARRKNGIISKCPLLSRERRGQYPPSQRKQPFNCCTRWQPSVQRNIELTDMWICIQRFQVVCCICIFKTFVIIDTSNHWTLHSIPGFTLVSADCACNYELYHRLHSSMLCNCVFQNGIGIGIGRN